MDSGRLPLGLRDHNEALRGGRHRQFRGFQEDGVDPRTGDHRPYRADDAPEGKVDAIGSERLVPEDGTIDDQDASDEEERERAFEVVRTPLQSSASFIGTEPVHPSGPLIAGRLLSSSSNFRPPVTENPSPTTRGRDAAGGIRFARRS